MTLKETVWRYLISEGMTPAGAAGMMGNLQAESGIIPNRVEILCLNRYKEQGKYYTDATYTAFVDDGTISKGEFLRPMGKSYGYGLAQWTSQGRKQGLYDWCKGSGVSIGDLNAQLTYLLTELKTSYKTVWQTLITTSDIKTASDIVLTKFEMPADQGDAVKNARYKYSKAIYDEFVKPVVSAGSVIDIMRSWIGYNEMNGKHKQIVDIYNQWGASHGYPRGYKVSYADSWCDVTVSAAFIKAGGIDLLGGAECGVEEHVKLFKAAGIWKEDGTLKPQPGWIVVYNWDKAAQPNDGYSDHIGIVESVSSETFVTIEGNYNNAVQRRTVAIGNGYIRGFAVPKYATAPQEPAKQETTQMYTVSLKTVQNGSQGATAMLMQRLLAGWGYTPGAIDGDVGPLTVSALKAFQKGRGLEVDGVCGPLTWGKLLGV